MERYSRDLNMPHNHSHRTDVQTIPLVVDSPRNVTFRAQIYV